ncbi:phosphoserine aminotransferase [Musa troglodytarum]|uniref:Phosphoserine aminotransferase n=1 Tax=Musa troglodytarum TaxID=320322 RepID=A0A9E7FI31_9LILI|nr:phosphoserine aminotransferase [Musa troglodytarum]
MAAASTPQSFLLQHPLYPSLKTLSYIPSKQHLRPRPRLSTVSCTAVHPAPASPSVTKDQDRIFNFAAGPATLPESVILKAQSELYNYHGSGMSIMEMSHRGKEFDAVIKRAESDLRLLLAVPDDYAVLFLQGGATTQFAAVPLNLCEPDDAADYIVTGSWGDKAFKEAQKFCKPNLIWSGKSDKYTKIPPFEGLEQNPNAKYLHICANETIHGVEFKNYPTPSNRDAILVADMSSNFCSKPVDVSKFGVIYAGAQKNVGPSGVTIVIVRKDLIGNAQPITPVMLDYKIHADSASLYNTPPCFTIYICGLVFEDLLEQGGLVEVEKKNAKKAGILYDAIDGSDGFYVCPVEKSVRSLMNVPFTLQKTDLEKKFIEEAAKEGMIQLKGHRSVGGVRASIYNAMPLAGVEKLVAFMKDFQARHL